MNKYLTQLEKSAALGDVGKALIRSKLGPAIGKMGPASVSKLESMSRAAAGSPLHSGVFSGGELAKHMDRMKAVGSKMLPSTGGVAAGATNKLTAVAARATRMGILKSAALRLYKNRVAERSSSL